MGPSYLNATYLPTACLLQFTAASSNAFLNPLWANPVCPAGEITSESASEATMKVACIVSSALVLAALAPAAADAQLTVSSASALLAKAAEIEGSAAEAAHRRLQQAATTPPQLVPFQTILLSLLRTVGPGRPVSFKNFESAGCQAFAEIAR